MKLQTQITISPEKHNPIDYHSKLLLLGSCFSENIGERLNYFKFQTNQNPFGILFHPKAIENLVAHAINEKVYTENDIFFLNERWHCFDAHSNLSTVDKSELLKNLNQQIKTTKKQLKEVSHIVITFGTSWVYRHIETDSYVANCHKVPQKNFLKEILSIDQITESLEAVTALIKSVNNDISITLTVSPVRHLKDGFIENQQSKAHLIAAIHQVVEPRKNIHYFPSYELMMDELRDYRFYGEDMIHPNKTAINYIWERFSDAWISTDSTQTMKEVQTIQNGINHKPFNSNSEKHIQFLAHLKSKIKALKKQYPFIEF